MILRSISAYDEANGFCEALNLQKTAKYRDF